MLQTKYTKKLNSVQHLKRNRHRIPRRLIRKYGLEVLAEGVAALEKRRRLAEFERAAVKERGK